MEDKKTPRLTVYFPENIKKQLEKVAHETGLSQTQLVVLATHTLLARYNKDGQAMFMNLTNISENDIL